MGNGSKNKDYLVQGTILVIASFVARVIGMIYRIPLTRILGHQGNTYYSTANEIYAIILMISSFSLPLAVSKLVSERLHKGQKKNAHKVFVCAMKFGLVRAGLDTMPVIVRNYTDDEATIIMVDSNIQREDILPSEKAKAYAMKYEAMKHQGSKGGSTLEEVGEAAGESGKTVQRYVWLARLSDDLLGMVDAKKIGIAQGVDISFLSEEQQQYVTVILQETGVSVSNAQAAKLKEYGKSGELTLAMVRLILAEEKPKERKVTIKGEKISRYFSEDYSNDDIESIIIQLLEEWQNNQ